MGKRPHLLCQHLMQGAGLDRSEVRAGSDTDSCAFQARLAVECSQIALQFMLYLDCSSADSTERIVLKVRYFLKGGLGPRRKVSDHFTYYSCVTSHSKAQLFFVMILSVDCPSVGPGRGPSGSCISWNEVGGQPRAISALW